MRDHNSVSLICATVSALQPVSCNSVFVAENSNETSFLQRGTKENARGRNRLISDLSARELPCSALSSGRLIRPPRSVPIARKKVLHYLTLDIIGDAPTRPGDKADDLSLDLLLTRLKNSAEDAPQYAGPVCVGTALGRILVPEGRAKIPIICCISHVSISIGIPVAKLNVSQLLILVYACSAINEALDNGYILTGWLSIPHA
jgi:hypothetical protein